MYHCKLPEGALFNETIPATEDFMFNACHMYVDGDVNKTVPCEEYHYEYGDVGPTITSKVRTVFDSFLWLLEFDSRF